MPHNLVGAVAALLVSWVVVHPHAVAARATAGNELCPVASDRLNRSVSYRNNVIRAPVTAAETTALLMILQGGESELRTTAIMRLAMAGDLDTFRLLLQDTDANGLFIYASRYLNADDTVCLDPELERAVREGLRDPNLGRALVGLLGWNTYRDIGTLHALREVPFEPTPALADKYTAFGRAITSTHLPDIEAEVLAHARSFLPFDIPVKKRVLPGLHQHYAEFFAERRYAPAVAYFREVLTQADRNEPMQSFQINYGMLRTVVQRGLGAIGGAEANALLIGELEEIAAKPLDPFAASELQNLGKLVLSATRPSELRAIIAAFERLLKASQPARYDYPMRRTVYATLAELNAAESTALLVAELKRYIGNEPPPNRDSVVARLFEALANVQDLDIEPVLALVDASTSPTDRRNMWHIAARHPSEISVDFLLAELRLSASVGTEAEQLIGTDDTKALLNTLVAFASPEYQNRVRDGLDDLFNDHGLAESDYVSASTRLNRALGNETPFYVAFRAGQAQQRAVEQQVRREASEGEGRRAMQAEFAAELARQSSAEGIAANIASLATGSGRANRAAQWLIIVGEGALPQLHEALAAGSTNDRQRFQIMSVLGEIGSPGSIAPLIMSAESGEDTGFYRPALFALALIPPTDESIAFANAQLTAGVAERRQVAGLVYLAQIRHAPSADLVARFTDDALTPGLRSTGLYLGARLGVPGTFAAIEAALQQATERSEFEFLLTSLGEAATSAEEFTRVASSAGFTDGSFSYRQELTYCAFLTAAGDRKVELAFEVLGDGGMWQRREAIRYLLETDPQGTVDRLTGGMGQFLPINKLLRLSSALQLLYSESRRMGYQLEQTDEGYVLTRFQTSNGVI